MLKSKAVRPSTHIWSGLAQVQISANQTLRTLFHTPSTSLPLPLQYAWPRRLRSFHPHSHGNSFSLARGRRQPWVQLAGFTLEILFITLAAMLISCSLVLSRSPSLPFYLSLIVWCPTSQYIRCLKIHGLLLNTYLYSVFCYCYPPCLIATWKLHFWMSRAIFSKDKLKRWNKATAEQSKLVSRFIWMYASECDNMQIQRHPLPFERKNK